MIKIAIVGNIASGKSTVEKIIEQNGYKVFDTDKIAHEILAQSNDVKRLFGSLDRKEIAKIVFTNPEKLKQLEAIIHPQVKNELLKIFKLDEEIIFVSVPQLFESGMETLFDKIIYVTADREIRKTRLIKRNSLTSEEAESRIAAQDEFNKKERSDFIITNNNSLNELNDQIKEVLNKLENL